MPVAFIVIQEKFNDASPKSMLQGVSRGLVR